MKHQNTKESEMMETTIITAQLDNQRFKSQFYKHGQNAN
jgi:hypothetical protein